MEIINVIVIKEGIVDSCDSFVIKIKQNSSGTNYENALKYSKKLAGNEKIKKAEALFIEKALEYGASEDDMESYIEDGYYAGGNFSICLVHSDIQQ